MLVSVRIKNFLTFFEETEFTMQAESICEFKDSIIQWNRNKTDEVNTVPLSILIGDNNSGKTNLMKTIALIKRIVFAKNINIVDESDGLVQDEDGFKPVALGISFIEHNQLYDYDLEFVFGEHPHIISEVLQVNRLTLFSRKNQHITIAKTGKACLYYDKKHLGSIEQQEKLAKGYPTGEIYLTGGFCYGVAYELIQHFMHFMNHKLEIHFHLDEHMLITHQTEIADFLNEINSPIDPNQPSLSKGSHRFLVLCDKVFDALHNGKTLCIDELDNGIQADMIMMLTSRLHNRTFNPLGAQLVFITHNPLFLNRDYIRRDEVTFFTKDKQGTHLTSLLHYAGRENNYMRKFINYEYGTIPQYNLNQFLPHAK